MLERLRDVVVRPLVTGWLATSEYSWRALPRPEGSATVQVAGPDPDRVLLAGSGIAMGYGVRSHDLALAGQLARQLAGLTGRGAQVEVVAREPMLAIDAVAALTPKRLRQLDAIVMTPGGFEDLLLLPATAWRRDVDAVLDHLASAAPASLHAFVVSVPPLPKIVRMPVVMGWLASLTTLSLNRQLRRACDSRPTVTFVPFSPSERAGRGGTGRTYLTWASLIAPSVAATLDETSREVHHRQVPRR